MQRIALLATCVVLAGCFRRASPVPTQAPVAPLPSNTPTPTPNPPLPLPSVKVIPLRHHTFQTFNNCGPASLSMQLSYFGINKSQQEIGAQLRPYQHPKGDNDDKSVTLEELAREAETYGLTSYHRPNGSTEMVKQFIAHDLPVVVRTWLKENEDIGHYRVIRGYDDTTQEFIQDDSLQGKNLRYSYEQMNALWEPFNFEYLVLVPKDKQELAQHILNENIDPEISWRQTMKRLEQQLQQNPNDRYALFNASVASYHLGDYANSALYFERVEQRLPSRMLWYQIEPIQSYYELGNYERVFSITNRILSNNNRAFSELYHIRGHIYKNQGNLGAARREFEFAIHYNRHFEPAKHALANL